MQKITFILCFICFFASAAIAQQQDVKIISRLSFSPALYDMIRNELSQILSSNINLIHQDASDVKGIKDETFDGIFLVESGYPVSLLPERLIETDIFLSFGWGLWINTDYVEDDDLPILDSKFFSKLLEKIDREKTVVYPWFESLQDRATVLNFNNLSHSTLRDYIDFLHKSMDKSLLNPLSIESGQDLAIEAFAAGDCVFTSSWAPLRVFFQQQPADFLPGKPKVVAFPQDDANKIFAVKLKVFAFDDFKATSCDDSNYENVEYLNFSNDIVWLERSFSKVYQRLIMGN